MRVLGINIVELVAGLLAIAIGVFAAITASSYPLGTVHSMGPGYVPLALGIILIVLGAGIVAIEGRRGAAPKLEIPAARPLLTIAASVLIFALTIERFGLLVAVFLAAFVATLSDRDTSLGKSSVISASLSVLALVVFYYGLGLQVRALSWPF